MLRIFVADSFEPKLAVKPYKPPRQPIQHLCQWWMDIKVVFPPYVVSCERPEVDFIKDYLVRVRDSPETQDKGPEKQGKGGDEGEEAFVSEGRGRRARDGGAAL